ncbi:MAG: amidohydrolase family protein [Spirochaetaceae bacterium]|nr:amidohydrolase family protein [Spirochaetaceae bacterium]
MSKILDPAREIVDPHHHLWPNGRREPYTLAELHEDLCSGHDIVQTVFVECGASYRSDGPAHLRPVGETAWVAAAARASASGGGPEIAGIVSFADLSSGGLLPEVLDAHEAAGEGRFRGIRHALARGDHRPGTEHDPGPARAGLAHEVQFQAGVRLLGKRGLTWESWHYHYQMADFIAVAKSAPDTICVLDHFGTPLGVGRYREQREEIFAQSKRDMAAAAALPNVVAKLGGMAMADNGFGWDKREQPVTAEEFAAAQREYYLHAIDCFGTGRCMLESNFPVEKVSVSYRVLYNAFKLITAGFSEPEKDALFSGTARRVYRLPPASRASRGLPH